MKERVRDYEPTDPRSVKLDRERRKRREEQDGAHEFEALFSMRDQITPDAKADVERAKNSEKLLAEKSAGKGFER